MALEESFWRMAVALGTGLLVGLQRERVDTRIAGLRSFALFSLFGYLCGILGGWIPAAGFLALAAILVAGSFIEHRHPDASPGITTEAAALLVFGNSVYLAWGSVALSTAFGVVVAALLAFKVELHTLARRLDEADFKAAVQLSLLSFVVLPVLPDHAHGPYLFFNPRNVWWMVLLVAAIGFAGYLAHKFMPARAGILAGGFVGGLVSSTATTVSYGRRVAGEGLAPALAATVIVMASAVVFLRIVLEVAVVSPGWLRQAAPPFLLVFAVLTVAAFVPWRRHRAEVPPSALSNPSQLGTALLFGVVYSAVLLAVAAARDFFGDRGLYLVAAVSGISDVDAITLSTARMVEAGTVDSSVGWRVVMLASLSNLASKSILAATIGGAGLARQLVVPFGLAAMAGVAAIGLFW